MPTYEYECRECGGRVEAFQKMTDEPLTTCEKCGGPLRRLLFPVGIVFKGSGFYVTDYKNKENGSNGASSASDTKSTSEKSAKDSKPAESKPAATSSSS